MGSITVVTTAAAGASGATSAGLEQHCEILFNNLRSTAFQNSYFEKDNDASSGTKGDFIFKETDAEGNEIISIMFEMKNENDETTNKKRNEDFFAKLDKDRNGKSCEYAVLVSLFIYKDITINDLPRVFVDASKTTVMVMFIIANAILFAHVLTTERIPQVISEQILNAGLSPIMFLLIVNIILIIAGDFMEPTAILLILTPSDLLNVL